VLLESDLQLHRIAVRTVLNESLRRCGPIVFSIEQLLFNLIKNAIEANGLRGCKFRELLLRTEWMILEPDNCNSGFRDGNRSGKCRPDL